MALIRNSNAATVARSAVVLDLGDLRRQGEEMVRRAREEAARIVAEAREERARILAGAAETGREQGWAQGLEQGRSAGREEAVAQALVSHGEALGKLEGAWQGALADFDAQREALVQGAGRDILNLAVGIAERVIKRSIALDPGIAADQVAAALGVVVRPTQVVVHINPADRAVVERALPRLLAALPAIKHAELVEDAAIEPAGCIVRTRGEDAAAEAGGGEIDATLATQLDRIVEAILPGDSPT